MTHSSWTEERGSGSNQGAAKILLGLVLGALLVGGFGSLLGSGYAFVGTWKVTQGNSYQAFRFDSDGTYWRSAGGGLIGFNLAGTYTVTGSAGNTYRIVLELAGQKMQTEVRVESEDRLVEIDTDDGSEMVYTRAEDWVMAKRPSKTAESYDGSTPHVGCWMRQGDTEPSLRIGRDDSIERKTPEGTSKGSLIVDYSKVPFHFDVTDSDGQTYLGLFDFEIDGSLRLSLNGSPGATRPEEISRYQNYYPCESSDSAGGA